MAYIYKNEMLVFSEKATELCKLIFVFVITYFCLILFPLVP